jgi:NitT/TauT family transport system substrate-binding protein
MRFLIGILLFIVTIGCITSSPIEKEEPTIRIGYLGGVAQPEVYAMYNGFYEEEGLNISWISFRGGSSVIEAVIAGELDGGVIGSTPAIIRAVSKDVPIKVVAVGEVGTKEKPGDYLVVLKSSGIEDMADLKGKTIAVHRLGTLLDLTLRVGLEQNGIDPNTEVTITQVKIPNMPQALLNGEVDAAFVFPMAMPQLEDKVNVVFTPADVFPEGVPFGMVFFTEDFIQNHPDKVKSFIKAYLRGLQWAIDNPDKVPEIAAMDTGLPIEVTKKIPWPEFNPSGRVSDESFKKIIDAIKKYDPESLGRNVTVNEFIDYRFL